MAPNADSSATSTVLGVQGNSFSTGLVGLVNFRLPYKRLSSDNLGVDISAGPVFRFGSKSDTSAVGFFTGITLRFYRYFFITPGVHVGEFADYPQGFTHAGQAIPMNFGTPTAVKRTTAKFGVAVTFQTKDFKSLGKSSVNQTNTPAPAPAPGTKPQTPAPNPAPATQTVKPDPVSVDFGTLKTDPISQTLTLTNTGSSSVNLSFNVTGTSQVDFSDSVHCPSLAPGAKCTIALKLNAGIATPGGTFTISDNHGVKLLDVPLKWANGA
jgi:hypothetical protein